MGCTFNYGYQKEDIQLKVLLDCNERKLTITNPETGVIEAFNNLPAFPIVAAITNKGNSQVLIKYCLSGD